ncbi:MAG: galactose oxidase-like domain-containing protein, partial [Actinomycetota bacterium]
MLDRLRDLIHDGREQPRDSSQSAGALREPAVDSRSAEVSLETEAEPGDRAEVPESITGSRLRVVGVDTEPRSFGGPSAPDETDYRPEPGAQLAGKWETAGELPLLAAHAALLPGADVLFFEGSGNDEFKTSLPPAVRWAPGKAPEEAGALPADLFSAGQVLLPDGRLMVAGGTEDYSYAGLTSAYLFDPAENEWIRVRDIPSRRRSCSLVTLSDGRVLAAGGGGRSTTASFSVSAGWSDLSPVARPWPAFPHLVLLRDGRVAFTGGSFDAAGSVPPAVIDSTTGEMEEIAGAPTAGRCSSVLLPPAQDQLVMVSGSTSTLLDFSGRSPRVTAAPEPLQPRTDPNLVLLPDRTVLMCGGTGPEGPVLDAEIFDPEQGAWRTAAPARVPRGPRSTALLLPDGSVLVAGSNPGPRRNEQRLEIYRPPYLFSGQRPSIQKAPGRLQYGDRFWVETSRRDVKWLHLIRPAAVTHGFSEQRLVDIEFTQVGPRTLEARMPAEGGLAPPGWYLLFVVDANGVPSEGKWVRIQKKPVTRRSPVPLPAPESAPAMSPPAPLIQRPPDALRDQGAVEPAPDFRAPLEPEAEPLPDFRAPLEPEAEPLPDFRAPLEPESDPT